MSRLFGSSRALLAVLLLPFGILAAIPAFAGTQDAAVIALHAQAHTTKSVTVCTTAAPNMPCSEYVTAWPLHSAADVYLVVAEAMQSPGIAGVSFGVEYANAPGSGVDVFGYQLCADLEFPGAGPNGPWPAAGAGNRVVWDRFTNCQSTVVDPYGVHAIACAFYVYAYGGDLFWVDYNRSLESDPALVVADCSASETFLPLDRAGWIVFGAGPGCNPCVYDPADCDRGFQVPTAPTTWSRLKQRFGE